MKLDKLNNISIPEKLDGIKENIYNVPKKKKSKFRYVVTACLCIFILGFTVPGYTRNLPVYSQIFEFFGMENYQSASTAINQEVTDNGVTFTLVDAVYSGNEIAVTFEIKSDKLNGEKISTDFDLRFKGTKKDGLGGGLGIEYEGNNTYIGYLNMNVDFLKEPPKNLEAKLKLKDIEIFDEDYNLKENKLIKGIWEFEFPIKQLNGKILTNDFVDKKDKYYAKINKILVDDLGVAFTINYWSDYDFPVWLYSNYNVFIVDGKDKITGLDDKGKPINEVNYIELQGGAGKATPEFGEVNWRSKPLNSGNYKMYVEMRKTSTYSDEHLLERAIKEFNIDEEELKNASEEILFEIPFTIE